MTNPLPAWLEAMRGTLPALLTVMEVAGESLMRCDRSTVDRLVKQGKFPTPVKIGGAIQRFSRDEVLAYLAAQQTAEPLQARTRKASRRKGAAK